MKLNRPLASHVLTLVILIALGAVVFHRSGAIHPIARHAPGSAQASPNVLANEQVFLVMGLAVVDSAREAEIDRLGPRRSITSDWGPAVEPTTRLLSIDADSLQFGRLCGILQDADIGADGRMASLTLHDRGGSDMRLLLHLKDGPTPGGIWGTYQILGGTGMFQRARGEGTYRDELAVGTPSNIVSVKLEGTIRY